ncbi:hypothetical protein EMQ25_15770 [Arsenicitalea aurantiaca]|uniref:OmpA-like domain-containing protein n=1 Tax=Arsenicitalea aurantiaca TaxID=1783274 RepID=A0A433X451_9HYPH|nr:flagellar motor protein MotB [Arsenicitalea aurantiaca]RUT28846.1 hypothetical protein EMQ25_15770 [Arsenicitalea aurantiaca]
MARKKAKAAGVPEWLVTFADLMSILVCFFVLIISFSIPDEERLQVVAGSMRDAFGMVDWARRAGVIEREGNPNREHMRILSPEETRESLDIATEPHDADEQRANLPNTAAGLHSETEQSRQFALAAASIRQAWQQMPDVTRIADNLLVEETPEGLAIRIMDQQGRPMFAEGAKYPFEATRRAIAALAPILARLPNPVVITGHVAAGAVYPDPRYDGWHLTADRANVVRGILEEFGLPGGRIHSVVGRGTGQPLFANDPYMSANQRVEILLRHEAPPVPADLRP